MKAKSFIEILEEQLRKELRKEIEAEVRAELAREKDQIYFQETQADPTENLAARLSAGLKRFTFRARNSAAYPHSRSSQTARPSQPAETAEVKPPRPERRIRAETFEALCALELLRRHSGGKLPECFSEAELKAAWRQAALKTHPDRHMGADASTQAQTAALFRELQTAYSILTALFHADSEVSKAA